MANEELLDLDYLSQIIHPEFILGNLIWKNRTDIRPDVNARFVGKIAGSIGKTGYIFVNIKGKHYRAHRLMWFLYYGQPANGLLDHIDGNRANNSILNLRVCNNKENVRNSMIAKNNTSGFKGVSFCKQTQRWVAQITVDYKNKKIGRFHSKEEAHAAYAERALMYHGEFARLK